MSAGRKKILWLDNEIEFFRSQITFLETRGYSIIPVFTSEELIDLIHQNDKYGDLILIDDKVDGVGDLSVVVNIRKINPHLPVVLITQDDSGRLKKNVPGSRVDAVIMRPCTANQVLAICKKLFSPAIPSRWRNKDAFMRSYSAIRSLLAGNVNIKDYYRIYEKILYWELEIENSDDEGLRQALAGLKSDANTAFSNFIIENYGPWINGQGEAPLFGYKVIEKEIMPLLTGEKKCILVVLSGMRLDQYLAVESILKETYSVKRHCFLSTLPSSEEFSRIAFFAGEHPLQIVSKYPGLFKESGARVRGSDDEGWMEEASDAGKTDLKTMEDMLLYQKFSKNGTVISDQEPYFAQIGHSADAASILLQISSCTTSQLITLVIDLDEHIIRSGAAMQQIDEYQSDELSRRKITGRWFQESELFKAIQSIASSDIRLIIASDHGSVLCSRATEIYNAETLDKNRRYKFGRDISADERRVVFLPDPSHFGLPSMGEKMSCIIAKENFYFSLPEKFEFYHKEYRASFQKGGISLEEMIMPLGIFQPE